MIEIYSEIGSAIAKVADIRWVDIAPRVEDHTNLYPAAYIAIEESDPVNAMGGAGLVEFIFRVELWLKPYHSSTAKPLSPVLASLGGHMAVVDDVRRAVFNIDGKWVRATTLESETPEKMSDGFYSIVQRWRALSAYTLPDRPPLAKRPDLVMMSGLKEGE